MTIYIYVEASPKKGEQSRVLIMSNEIEGRKPDAEMTREEFFTKYNGIARIIDGKLFLGLTDEEKRQQKIQAKLINERDAMNNMQNAMFEFLAQASVDGAQVMVGTKEQIEQAKEKFMAMHETFERIHELEKELAGNQKEELKK